MIVYKNPGGNLTAPAPNTIGSNDNKRFVIHQETKIDIINHFLYFIHFMGKV